MIQHLVRLESVTKTYIEAGKQRIVLRDVTTGFPEGQFSVILGKSGSGKSTMLNMISGIDEPNNGSIFIGETAITTLNERDKTLFRRDQLGIVFQFFNLIPTLTVLENIILPYELAGASRKDGMQRAANLLEKVGLADRQNTFPDKLSGGEQQRVAIARALVHEPKVILADEPTGNLDGDTGDRVLELLLELTRDAGRTLIMVTHNRDITPHADQVYRLSDGQLLQTEADHI